MRGGGSPNDGPPQPQFLCDLKKNFLQRLWRSVLFGPSDGPPHGEGGLQGGGATRACRCWWFLPFYHLLLCYGVRGLIWRMPPPPPPPCAGTTKGTEEFPTGFQRLPRSFQRFPKGFQRLSQGFARGFQTFASGFQEFPRGFQRISGGFQIHRVAVFAQGGKFERTK